MIWKSWTDLLIMERPILPGMSWSAGSSGVIILPRRQAATRDELERKEDYQLL